MEATVDALYALDPICPCCFLTFGWSITELPPSAENGMAWIHRSQVLDVIAVPCKCGVVARVRFFAATPDRV